MGKEKRSRDGGNNPKSGRLGRLDEDTFGYYRRVSDVLIEKNDDAEDLGKINDWLMNSCIIAQQHMVCLSTITLRHHL